MVVNKKNYKGEFQLDPTDEVFAASVGGSVSLIEKIDILTGKLSVTGLDEDLEKPYLVGNIDCRYCGRYYDYNGKSIFIGLSFSSVGFDPDYRLLLQVCEGEDEGLNLTGGFMCAKSQFFPPVDERWLIVTLDKYLIFEQTGLEFQKEVERVLKNLNL